jgi:hypothetical protein
MINSGRILTWFTVGYYAIFIASSLINSWWSIKLGNPFHDILFIVTPMALLVWQALIVHARSNESSKETASPFYERLTIEDWRRLFFILLLGQTPLASRYVWGFWLFSGIVIALVIFLIYTASVEYYRRRTWTSLMIGCLVFTFVLLVWEKDAYVIHHGVPVIGHFLEKPEYDAIYQVEIEPEDSNVKYKAIADIHVGGTTRTEEAGENYYGNPRYVTTTYRVIRVKKLYFPDAGSVEIQNQDEWMNDFGDTTFVEDTQGKTWYVKLLPEPVQ